MNRRVIYWIAAVILLISAAGAYAASATLLGIAASIAALALLIAGIRAR